MDIHNQYKTRNLVGLLMIVPILSMACALSVPFTASRPSSQSVQTVQQPVQPLNVVAPTPIVLQLPKAVTDEQGILVELYQRTNPAVVNITNYAAQNGQATPVGQGSGFVYDINGNIVTNAHVVDQAAQIQVTFSDNTIEMAKLVGEDLNADLAVIKVEKLPAGVGPLPLGDMSKVQVGETVVAIGNPFGLEGTLTKGIVSAMGRTIPALTSFSIPEAIQTDAAINPGNSGGPLLNLQGEVIGVNAQIETGTTSNSNSGVGFAVPVSIIKLVVPDLIQKGSHTWAWMGVRVGIITPDLIAAMKLPVNKGAYLSDVVSGGPADKAGLHGSTGTATVDGRSVDVGGDIITAIDNQPISNSDDILIYIALNTTPGQTVTLTIVRDGKTQNVQLTMQERPKSVTP